MSTGITVGRQSIIVRFPFRGLMAPVFTPFDKDQNVDTSVIMKYAQYLHTAGITGVLVNGSVGEGMSLSEPERKAVLEAWVEASYQFSLTVMVQIGGTNLHDVKSLARHAEKCKVSGILCLADLYYKPQDLDDLIRYLRLVAAEAPRTPLLYYHIPSMTGINRGLIVNMKELLDRAHEIPTFMGIKFTDTDLYIGGMCASEHVQNLAVFLGADSLLLPALFLGFDSAINTTINLFPNYNKQIVRYFNEKDFEKAAKTQQTLNNCIHQITAYGTWLSSMKAAMNKITPVNVGRVRDPLTPVNLDHVKFSFI